MVEIEMKLSNKSCRNFLTTQSGYTITKNNYVIVDDKDRDIQSFIINRNDVLIRDKSTKKIKDEIVKDNVDIFIESNVDDKILINQQHYNDNITETVSLKKNIKKKNDNND